MASKNIQNIIRNLFDPNASQSITASDLQLFVDLVFESTESVIRKFKTLSEVEEFRLSNTKPIEKGDLVIVSNDIFISEVTKPSGDNFTLLTKTNSTKNQTTTDCNNRPTTPETGDTIFDTTLGIPLWYNQGTWVDATGTRKG